MLNEGMWDRKRLISKQMVETLISISQEFTDGCGLLWWRIHNYTLGLTQKTLETWIEGGLSQEAALGASSLLGKSYMSPDEYRFAVLNAVPGQELAKLNNKFLSGELKWVDKIAGPLLGYSGRGYLGQYLVVIPESNLVAVRMRHRKLEGPDQQGEQVNTYSDFEDDILKLAQSLK
jgi:hypothetical protein